MLRKISLFNILLISIFALAACGDDTESTDEKETEKEVRTYETVKGEVEIPAEPKRIVTDFYVGELLAVGANVIGADSDAFAHPFIEDELEKITDLGAPMNVEKILDLEPDLIITMYEDNYEEYSKIAPTLFIPWDAGTDIYETVETFADITGTQSEGEDFITDYEKTVEDAKEKMKGAVDEDATVGIYELTPDDKLYVFGENFGRGGQAVYHALGFNASEKIDEDIINGEGWKEISFEVLPDYAADYMFLTVYDPDETGKSLEKLQEMSIYKNLDAVKKGTFFVNDFDTFYRYDPIAIREQVKLFADLFAGKQEGNE